MSYTHRPKITCNCPRCASVGRNRRHGLLITLLVGGLVAIAAIVGNAQIPVSEPMPIASSTICLYHPESLQTIDPAQRSVIVHARRFGWPTPVNGIDYIRSEWPSGNPDRQAEAISAAIQYSVYLSPGRIADAQRVMIADYLPHLDPSTIPTITLHEAVRQYLWTGNTIHRSTLAYWLRQAINAPSNSDCNPWHNYGGGR